jgi:hypothetical protein
LPYSSNLSENSSTSPATPQRDGADESLPPACCGYYWCESLEGSVAPANKASNARLPLSPERAMRGCRIAGCAACARSR